MAITISKNELDNLYWEQQLSQAGIGKIVGLSQGTIHNLMSKYGILARSLSESHKVAIKSGRSDTETRTLRPNLTLSPSLAYIVGVLKGDGSTSHWIKPGRGGVWSIRLTVVSERFALEFYTVLVSIGLHPRLTTFRPSGYKVQYHVKTSGKLLIIWYRALSLNDISTWFSEAALAVAFLKGLYESEGHLHSVRGYNEIQIVNTSWDIINLVCLALNSLGFHPRVLIAKRGGRKNLMKIVISPTANALRFIRIIKPCIRNRPTKPRRLSRWEGDIYESELFQYVDWVYREPWERE